jgi:hypothetical protein
MISRLALLLCVSVGTAANAVPVTLTWDVPVGYTPTGYVVGYGETSGTYSITADVGNTRIYTFDKLDAGQTYYISVMAYSNQGSSAWASELAVAVLPEPPPLSVSVSPAVGLWGNAAEPGSGYSLDFKHGVLVVTVYSYNADGTPQWYLAAGPLQGTTFVSQLSKYVGGQCISCAYAGTPTAAGSDGTITLVFSSSRSATVHLPGGRVSEIQPTDF